MRSSLSVGRLRSGGGGIRVLARSVADLKRSTLTSGSDYALPSLVVADEGLAGGGAVGLALSKRLTLTVGIDFTCVVGGVASICDAATFS